MKERIFWAMCLIIVISIVLTTLCISVITFREFRINMEAEVKNQTEYIAAGVEEKGQIYLERISNSSASNRITLINEEGTVVYDNEASVATMGNHSNRLEVSGALATGIGESTRLSATMGQETYYYAIQLSDGTVLRVANTIDSVFATAFSLFPWMITLILLTFLITLFISRRQTKWIVAPLNSLDLENPIENNAYEELSPLLLRIHRQNQEIEEQFIEIRHQQKEFQSITENMTEGLILLGLNEHILSINSSAKKLLDSANSGGDFEGRHILELNRNLSLQKVAELALKGDSATETFTQDSRFCVIQGSPVYQDGEIRGAILLVMDVTQKHEAEQMRREFSANVSHELKTPLTAISGYAELMENGMVESKDIKDFSTRIHGEALHLIDLIDDIIEISRLDEKNISYLWEQTDLFTLAQDVAGRLEHLAKGKNIEIEITGESTILESVTRLMDELVYNLMDNAIKYSDNNTKVTVTVANTGSMALVTVSDQGVGIPAEYQDRVFERFFRVDQSHAKSTGGTGLGLAIVKHVVAYHKGNISLDSVAGEGTKITVSFPL